MRSLLVCLVLLWLVPAPVDAQTWTYASTEHFEVYTTGGPRRAREALERFERVRTFFTEFLGLTPRTPEKTRLIVFSGPDGYAPYRAIEAASAFYTRSIDRDYIVMQELDERWYPVVVHEYVHLIVRDVGLRLAPWQDEGLAEYFSTLTPAGDKMSVGAVPAERLLYFNSSYRLMGLPAFFAVTQDSPEYNAKAHAGLFYAQSWALMHMLLMHEQYAPRAIELIKTFEDGPPSVARIEAIYGKTAAEIEKDLLSYINRTRFRFTLADYRMSNTKLDMATRAVSDREARHVTASLLAISPTKSAEARASLMSLASEGADADVFESLAYLELRGGNEADAVKWLARAVEAGSRRARLYRDYAVLIGATRPAEAEPLLVKAQTFDATDMETHLRLAEIRLRQTKASDALKGLQAVQRVTPDIAFRYFLVVANAYAQLRQWPEASRAAERAAGYARSAEQSAQAANLLGRFAQQRDSATVVNGSPTAQTATTATESRANTTSPDRGESGLVFLEGRLVNMVCEGNRYVLEVSSNGVGLRLLLDDVKRVLVNDSGGTTVDLLCGAHNRPVVIGYEPVMNATAWTVGNVRRLDFRTPAAR